MTSGLDPIHRCWPKAKAGDGGQTFRLGLPRLLSTISGFLMSRGARNAPSACAASLCDGPTGESDADKHQSVFSER